VREKDEFFKRLGILHRSEAASSKAGPTTCGMQTRSIAISCFAAVELLSAARAQANMNADFIRLPGKTPSASKA
jgi:hypothetical protein